MKSAEFLILLRGKKDDTPRILLSATSVSEDAAINDVIGILSVKHGSGTYTFTITADPDAKFQIANDDELQLADTVEFDESPSHQVTIEADNGVDDPISRTFTISVFDVTAPTILSLVPDDDEIDVDVDTTFVATFSENIFAGTGQIELGEMPSTTIESFDIATGIGSEGGTVSIAGAVLTITPGNDLEFETDYYIGIQTTAIKDGSNNFFAGIVDNTTWNVTSEDDSIAPDAPVLTWTSDETTDPPEFNIEIDETVAEGDEFELQYDDDPGFGSATTVQTTVSADDISGLEIIFGDDEDPLDPFGNGVWYVRCRVGPTGALSDWSNTVEVTIDIAATAREFVVSALHRSVYVNSASARSFADGGIYIVEDV